MNHATPDRAHLLTIEEAAECLGIGRSKIYDLMTNGELASIKIGARRLVAVSSVTEYIRRQLGQGDRQEPLTSDALEALVESGEIQTITVGKFLFVSVDSLGGYLRHQAEIAS